MARHALVRTSTGSPGPGQLHARELDGGMVEQSDATSEDRVRPPTAVARLHVDREAIALGEEPRGQHVLE